MYARVHVCVCVCVCVPHGRPQITTLQGTHGFSAVIVARGPSAFGVFELGRNIGDLVLRTEMIFDFKYFPWSRQVPERRTRVLVCGTANMTLNG